MQNFITAHKAAFKTKITKEQLADYLGILPKTVDRKRQKIQAKVGLSLPKLVSDKNIEEIPFENYQEFLSELNDDQIYLKSVNIDKTKKRYVITSAQFSTPINTKFVKSLKNYCDKNDAQLLIIPYRYNNPTSIWNAPDEYISPDIAEYVLTEHVELTPMLQILGDTRIVPTAIQPIHGIDALTGSASGIVGHSKVQLTTIPTPSKDLPKILTSTGTVTIPNYTPSKAGKRGEFHHTFAACVVELEGKRFHIRHIHADEKGGFYDLDKYYAQDKVKKSKSVPALIMGDYHAVFADGGVNAATFTNKDSMVNVLNPENLIYHDVLDFYHRNHHHRGNDIIRYGKHHFGRDNVEEELQITADLIDDFNDPKRQNIIVRSNHDEALDRWLSENDPRNDPENARLYYYLKYHQMVNTKMTDNGFSTIDAFAFWCANPDKERGLRSIGNTKFLGRGEHYEIENIIISFHGDKGPNGARGSVKNLAKLGSKVVIGHSHSPNIYEGAYQVGVSSTLQLEYAAGSPSSWMHTHCIIYPNGKRTLVHIVGDSWKSS